MDALVGEAARLLFTQGGLLGALSVLEAIGIVYLFKSLQTAQDKRIADAGVMATLVERNNNTIATLNASVEARNAVISDLARTVAEQARTSEREIGLLQETVAELRRAIDASRYGGGRA
jgi:hypothetical protein